jgi:hypothetical protein
MAVASAVEIVDLAVTPLRELNQRLHDVDDGSPRRWRVLNPNGAHAVVCGVDLNGVAGLDVLEERDGELHVGALVRRQRLLEDELVASSWPLLPEAARFVDYKATRRRGTVDYQETPSPYTPYGIKGAGEGGRMLTPAILSAAIEDALEPYGVCVTSLPIAAEQIVAWASPA